MHSHLLGNTAVLQFMAVATVENAKLHFACRDSLSAIAGVFSVPPVDECALCNSDPSIR